MNPLYIFLLLTPVVSFIGHTKLIQTKLNCELPKKNTIDNIVDRYIFLHSLSLKPMFKRNDGHDERFGDEDTSLSYNISVWLHKYEQLKYLENHVILQDNDVIKEILDIDVISPGKISNGGLFRDWE